MITSQIKQTSIFVDLPETPATHFKLWFYAAVQYMLLYVAGVLGSYEAVWQQFPFLKGYYDELVARGPGGQELNASRWYDALATWEMAIPGHLPLRALREAAALDALSLSLLLIIGLVEEDVRFGFLFEALQGGQRRPTAGLLDTLGRSGKADTGWAILRQLLALGLVQVANADMPRTEWTLQLPPLLWDALRGDIPAQPDEEPVRSAQSPSQELAPWLRYHAPQRFPAMDDLVVPASVSQLLHALPVLLASGDIRALVVRGPQHNGRRTLVGAIARFLGRGVLEAHNLNSSEATSVERWRQIGLLATLLHTVPVVVLDIPASESRELPALRGYDGPAAFVLGKQGGISGPGAELALTITLDAPDATARRLHWQHGFEDHPVDELDAIAERVRMTSGNIHRTARLAHAHAALACRPAITLADVRQASRALHRQELETLATPLPAIGDWNQLALRADTMRELEHLENRCRHRERLHTMVGSALGAHLNAGVRALFSGASGTGKTLAARLLAAALAMDVYRLDLASLINKYIGETEKNLNRLFARAEELDVILLLDEGDALLTKRTTVQNANDRYANLETNYLLQRLETFEGILLVTTNAGDRIDTAFRRRMDIVVEFHPPDMAERWLIWQLHLPITHAIDESLLREVAGRCSLTGGQIRNAVLHASLLALNDGDMIRSAHLEAAVQREYRKMGAVCPLRSSTNWNT